MHSDIKNLRELQEADRETARLNAEVASLPKRVALIEAKLADSKSRKQAAEAAIKAGEANRRKYEAHILDLQQKISKYRDQMLDVKTNEQYRALTHEVEFGQKQIREIEDKILEQMVAAESLERDLKKADAELKEEAADIEREKAEAHTRTEEDEKLLAEWNAKRATLRAAISPDTLRHYDRVSKLRGSGLAEAVEHRCSACHVMLRPQVYNDVRANDTILTCDSCQRILWFDSERLAEEQEQAVRVFEGSVPPSVD
jgi:uncharacterized protein